MNISSPVYQEQIQVRMVEVGVKSSTSEQWADDKSLMVQPCKLVQQRWHSQQLRVIIWISV